MEQLNIMNNSNNLVETSNPWEVDFEAYDKLQKEHELAAAAQAELDKTLQETYADQFERG